MSTLAERSRDEWNSRNPMSPTEGELKLGCLQRIASATEAMAKEYNRLLADAKWQREARNRACRRCDYLGRSNAALRGHIKRLKRANVGNQR